MSKTDLKKYGFIKKYFSMPNIPSNQKIGRVISRHNENYNIITEIGEISASLSEGFKLEAKSLDEYPVAGDFVVVELEQGGFNSTIKRLIKRRNTLVKKGEWDVNYDHVVASNIDTIFICISLNNDYNIEKVNAYINISNKLNAESVLVLTECDSFNNIDSILSEVKSLANGMEVIVTSGMNSDGYKSIKNYIQEGSTVVFIGPEHDKVKIVNKLLGNVTFNNDLILLPSGGVLINTPEMQELGIESINITKKFADLR